MSTTTATTSEELIDRATRASRLALVLDYDGTLCALIDNPEEAAPPESLLRLIQRLSDLDGVSVAVVSGRPQRFLERHLGHLAIDIVAEHGFFAMAAGETWREVVENADLTWIEPMRVAMARVTDEVPRSLIEHKRSSIVWHYRGASPSVVAARLPELAATLERLAEGVSASVSNDNYMLEVASDLVHKGVAVGQLLDAWQPDLAIAMGDAPTDENMFALASSYPNLATVKVGSGPTAARMRLEGVTDVHAFLTSVAQARG